MLQHMTETLILLRYVWDVSRSSSASDGILRTFMRDLNTKQGGKEIRALIEFNPRKERVKTKHSCHDE